MARRIARGTGGIALRLFMLPLLLQVTGCDTVNPDTTLVVHIGDRLKRLDLGAGTNILWLHCANNKLAELDLSANTKLKDLQCSGNRLARIDLSANTNLVYVYLRGNNLTNLDVSRNTRLTYLCCSDNQLTQLDVSANPMLVELYCDGNRLTSLDLSAHSRLTALGCQGNKLTRLDLSANTNLTRLSCSANNLTALDLSACPELRELYCSDNGLTNLDLSANPKLKCVICTGCPIVEIVVAHPPGLPDEFRLQRQAHPTSAEPGRARLKSLMRQVQTLSPQGTTRAGAHNHGGFAVPATGACGTRRLKPPPPSTPPDLRAKGSGGFSLRFPYAGEIRMAPPRARKSEKGPDFAETERGSDGIGAESFSGQGKPPGCQGAPATRLLSRG